MNSQRRPSRWVPVAVAGAGVLAAVGLIWFWARSMLAQKSVATRQVAQLVQLIRPPPPVEAPPPPPPPDKIEEPLPQETPEPEPAADNAAQQLGLDTEGTAGSDAFGLAARHGGTDLVGTGTAIFGHYTSLLKDAIVDTLSEDERVRRGSYAVVVRVWVAADGRVEHVLLAQSSGKRELDAAIEQALARLDRVKEAPPLEMPQPVTLKIISRG